MKRTMCVFLLILMALLPVPGQDTEQWQREVDRITEELNETKPRRERHGWFAAGGAGLALAGLILAGNGYNEDETVRSWPMVIGGFSVAGIGAAGGLGFGISWGFLNAEVGELHRERRSYHRRIQAVERREELIEEYGVRTANAIANHEVFVGMDASAVRRSWGRPDDINRTITSSTTHEQWIYDHGEDGRQYVYVENGTVTALQD